MPLINRFLHAGGAAKTDPIFGDGSDGDLIISAGQTVTLPVDHPHRDIIIKQYKSIRIETGGTLTTAAPNCGLVLRCKGDCVIDGVIDQNGKGGANNYENTYEYPNVKGGRGGNGGDGGQGGKAYKYTNLAGGKGSSGIEGRPYGGGLSGMAGGGAGGQLWAVKGTHSKAATVGGEASVMTGATFAHGAAGAGGVWSAPSGETVYNGGRGGQCSGNPYGGGAVFLYVAGSATIRGSITCNGLNGQNGGNGGSGVCVKTHGYGGEADAGGGSGGGGGAGGGVVYVCYKGGYLMTGTFSVNAGTAGIGGKPGANGVMQDGSATASWDSKPGTAGTAGTIGQIKIVKYEEGMTA